MNPSDEILLTRVEATMTVPVDLSTNLDQDAPPVLTEHEIVVSITSPNAPLSLVSALAVTLTGAVQTVVNETADFQMPAVIQTDDPNVKITHPGVSGVIIVPKGVEFHPDAFNNGGQVGRRG